MAEISFATFTERGVRRDNEDYCQVVVSHQDGRYLFVVCDGMGGHAMGEVASQVVCSAICDHWSKAPADADSQAVLRAAYVKATEALDAKADVLNHVEMGTTMVLAAIAGDQVTIAHAGDSRAYLLRPDAGVVHQTQDHINHSVWGDFIDRSFFSYESEKARVETRQYGLQAGDRILLCTDGVYQAIAPDILTRRVLDDKTPEEIIDVIKFMCEKFSNDNYTGILVCFG